MLNGTGLAPKSKPLIQCQYNQRFSFYLFNWNNYVRDALLEKLFTLLGQPFVHLFFDTSEDLLNKLGLILVETEIERDLVIGPLT